MRPVPEAVQPQDGPQEAHVPAHRAKTVRVRDVRQGFHQERPHAQALRDAHEEAARGQGRGRALITWRTSPGCSGYYPVPNRRWCELRAYVFFFSFFAREQMPVQM